MTGEDRFLDRWSRRKVEERKTTLAPGDTEPQPDPAVEEDSAPGASGSFQLSDPAPISEQELAALPPVETLTAQSDLRAFLRPGVPPAVKNAAMRRMWLLTPAIRDHKDCAVDYAWDWNTPGGVPGNGGSMTAESVARMLSDLTKPSPDPGVQRDSAKDNRSAPPQAESAAPPCETPAESAEKGAQPAEIDANGDRPAAQSGIPFAGARRHGGAMPT